MVMVWLTKLHMLDNSVNIAGFSQVREPTGSVELYENLQIGFGLMKRWLV